MRRRFNKIFGNQKWAVWLLIALSACYMLAATAVPHQNMPTAQRYRVSDAQSLAVTFSMGIILIVIWGLATYSFMRVRHYALILKDSDETPGFNKIADGLLVLAIGMPLHSINNTLTNGYAASNPAFKPTAIILQNYVSLLVSVASFVLLSLGAKKLYSLTSVPLRSTYRTFAVAFALIAALYIVTTFTNPARQFATTNTDRAAYYLPDSLLLLTIVLPYLTAWFYGLRAVLHLHIYRSNVSGIVYRSALSHFASGVMVVIMASLTTQILTSLTTVVTSMQLQALLFLLYCMLLIIGIGFMLIAKGAQQLKRIERV